MLEFNDEVGVFGKDLVIADKKTKRELYNEGNIITIGETPVTSQKQESKQRYLELVAAQETETPLEGTIVSSKVLNGIPMAKIMYGDFQVLIPVDRLCQLPSKIEGDETAQLNFKKLKINQRIQSEVEFIPEYIDEENKLASGNRLKALKRKIREYYMTKDRNGNYRINEGDIAEARVTYTATDRIGVEVFGVERELRQKDISWLRIANVTDEYYVGDIIKVKITKLERVVSDGQAKLDIAVSAKEVEPNPAEIYYDSYEIGEVVGATVTQIDEHGMYVRLGGENGNMDAMIPFVKDMSNVNEIVSIPLKSTVLVKITHKVDEKKQIYCRFSKLVRKPI